MLVAYDTSAFETYLTVYAGVEDLVTVITEWKQKQEAEAEPADGQNNKRKMPSWFKDDQQGAAEMILPAGK